MTVTYLNNLLYRYRRIKITKILNDKIIEVFFVDFGEFQDIEHNSLFEIHPDLIIQLPFQVCILIISIIQVKYFVYYMFIFICDSLIFFSTI